MTSINLSSKNINDSQNIFFTFKEPSKIINLDLSNNNLTKIPDNLAHLSNLEKLDLINNPFEDYELIGRALSTLPKLNELKIDLTTQENAFLILSQLPKLLLLNGKSTTDEDEEKNQIDLNDTEIDKSSLANEIPNFNSVTNRITEILTQRNETTNEFYTEFQGILKTQIECINSLDNTIPNYVYSSFIQQAKVEIYSYLQNKILNMINTKVDYLLINLLNEVNQYIKKILGETILIIRNIYPKYKEIETNYKDEISQKDIKINELSQQIKYLNENNNKKESINPFLNNEKKNKLDNNNLPGNKNNYDITDRNNKNPFENNTSNFSISYNEEDINILDHLKVSNIKQNEDIKKIKYNSIQNKKNIYNLSQLKMNNSKNNINNKENNNINFNNNKISEKKSSSEISIIKNNNNFLNEPSLSYQTSLSNISQISNITNAPPTDLRTVIGPISK